MNSIAPLEQPAKQAPAGDHSVKTSSDRSGRRWYWLWWLLVVPLLWWALRDIRLADIVYILARLSVGQVASLVILNTIIILLISLRWWLILRAQGYLVTLLPVAAYRLISFGISYFTPGPQFGGEPAQVLYLQKRHHVPVADALASVSLDKLLELLANFAFLIFGIFAALQADLLLDLPPAQMLGVMAGALVLLLGYTLAVWSGRKPLAAILKPWARRSQFGLKFFHSAESAETQIGEFCRRQPRTVILASLLSLATWGGMLLEYWVMLHFLGIQVKLVEAIASLTASRIAFLFPLPGGLGVLEASQVLVLQALGFNPAAGVSASLLMRARDITLGLSGLLVAALLTRQARIKIDTEQAGAKPFETSQQTDLHK